MSAVVVDFPTEPVMPMVRAGLRSRKRFISVVRGMPAARAAWTMGDFFLFVDGGVDDQEVGGEEIFEAVAAELELDGEVFELLEGGGEFFGGVGIVDGDAGALLGEPLRDADAATEAAEAHDEDLFGRREKARAEHLAVVSMGRKGGEFKRGGEGKVKVPKVKRVKGEEAIRMGALMRICGLQWEGE